MASSNNNRQEDGFLLIDVLVGLFIATIITTAFIGSVVGAIRYASLQAKAVQAELLAIELLEVARELEISNWAELTTGACSVTGSTCHPSVVSGDWQLESGEESIGGFTRSLSIEAVERDASFAITGTGTIDPGTWKVVASVVWNTYGSPHTLVLESYVYDHS